MTAFGTKRTYRDGLRICLLSEQSGQVGGFPKRD
jgi:hypothetical protein